MGEVHNSLIPKAAKTTLAPLGFRRKGRSRIWLADHDYWLAVVEFQPSGWTKGSYLNVSAHWLWTPPDEDSSFILSFDFGDRAGSFVDFHEAGQFVRNAAALATVAAQEASSLHRKFQSINAVAGALLARERQLAEEGHGGHWHAYHAGVACVLADRIDDSAKMLGSVLDSARPPGSFLYPRAKALVGCLENPDRLRHELRLLINQHRAFFKYPALDSIPAP